MHLDDEPLTGENLDAVVAFARRSNPFAQRNWGWDAGRFMDWRWGSNTRSEAEHPGWFADHCRVFRSDGRLAAVAIAEYGGEDVCVITEGPDAAVVESVFAALIERRTDDGVGLRFEVADTAAWLRPVFDRFGFVETPRTGTEWEYELAGVPDSSCAPAGFMIESLAEDRSATYDGIAECVRRAFNSEHDIRSALESLEANPMFRAELSVFARSPDGRIAAYCRGTVDPGNGVCGIDPVCTDPDFRRLGLGRAVVQQCFRTLRSLGGLFCYIGSAPEPAPSTYLYQSLDPFSKTVFSKWGRL
jgi:ribosomal protein S18 acetylase RimI-like enzyme